jgi:hypothetical protein
LITDKGRNILAKYLIGQAPSYASFIALGIGPKPRFVTDPSDDFSQQTEMGFEALRIPISSRGYVYDDFGNANVVFSGELPSEQRYEFSEIGLFSAKSNPAAGSLGSRMIYTFASTENWEYHDETSAGGLAQYSEPLFLDEGQNTVAVEDVAFRSTSNNALFSTSNIRKERYEQPRFLESALFIRGDMSRLESINGSLSLVENTELLHNSSHIHLAGVTPNFNQNPPTDELRLAFSVLNKLDVQSEEIDSIKILIEFASTDAVAPDNYARMEIDQSVSDSQRYIVAKSSLQNLVKSTGFTWSNVNVVKIYVSVYETSEYGPLLSPNFYVALDGLRFENVTAVSPLYGLTGYTVVRNEDASAIVKESNSSNLVEFRFGLEVS